MRLYGGRILRNRVNREIEARKETRDAIIYDVLPAQRLARVKIQGSNELIVCYYPENWEQTPTWLKPGNAARITHTGGNRGRIELSGHGMLIPTPIAGGSGAPEPPTPGDTILTGMRLFAASPAVMSLTVEAGTYRIDGITYELVALVMPRTDIVMPRTDIVMGQVSAVVNFAAAHATLFRYDLIVAGEDGLAEVVQGSNFAHTAPQGLPETPADHILLGWVLIYPNMTEIRQSDINRMFTTPIPSELRVIVADDELEWDETPPYPSTLITISIRDQYGNLISRAGEGYYVRMDWIHGNGTLSRDYGTIVGDESESFAFYMASQKEVTYTRDNTLLDQSPSFYIVESFTGLPKTAGITLLSETGLPMY